MPVSTFTWLDATDKDQQRVREALAAFEQPGMVDPLGLGVIRDTFSDILFPGISTIQTRARYFLLVPWVFRRLDREKTTSSSGLRRARELEVATIEALMRGSSDREGIIGRESGAATKRLASVIYWGGLGAWGIRRFDGTIQEYVATLDRRRQEGSRNGRRNPAELLWPGLPEEPDGLFESATLELSPEESEFLRDRAMLATKGSYLELLLRDGSTEQRGDAPWTHPLAGRASEEVRAQLAHARKFAYAVWGAGLLYNVILSERLEEDGQGGLRVDYRDRLNQWTVEMESRRHEFETWNRADLWSVLEGANPRVRGARPFIDWWIDEAVGSPRKIASYSEIGRRIISREQRVKGARAKLSNRRAREQSPAAQGGGLMSFRWAQVQRIVGDIHEGFYRHA